jgi:hypothetical protein
MDLEFEESADAGSFLIFRNPIPAHQVIMFRIGSETVDKIPCDVEGIAPFKYT